jgi:hypothetical protein
LPLLWFNGSAVFIQLARVVVVVGRIIGQEAELITVVALSLLMKMNSEERIALIPYLPAFAIVAVSRKLFGVWLPVLRTLFQKIPDDFVVAVQLLLDESEHMMLATVIAMEDDQQKLEDLEKKYPQGLGKPLSGMIFGEASFAVTRSRYIAACKHFLLAKFVEETLTISSKKPVIARN